MLGYFRHAYKQHDLYIKFHSYALYVQYFGKNRKAEINYTPSARICKRLTPQKAQISSLRRLGPKLLQGCDAWFETTDAEVRVRPSARHSLC